MNLMDKPFARRLTVDLTDRQISDLDFAANVRGVSRREIVTDIISAWLNDNRRNDGKEKPERPRG